MDLDKEVKKLLNKGLHDPNELFKIIYHKCPVDYRQVREAIHNAKTR